MKPKIQSIHFDADKKLLDFIEERVDKLDKYYPNIVGSEVILKVEKNSTTENKVAEIRLKVPGDDLFVKKQCKSFEEALDTGIDALKKQLAKKKEKG